MSIRRNDSRLVSFGNAVVLGVLSAPLLAFAQPNTFAGLVEFYIIPVINILIQSIFGIAFVYFTWKVFDSWVLHGGDQAKQAAGRNYALAAIIAFVVMISAWGIVRMLRFSIFGI